LRIIQFLYVYIDSIFIVRIFSGYAGTVEINRHRPSIDCASRSDRRLPAHRTRRLSAPDRATDFLPGSSGNTLTTAAGWNQQPVIAGILRGDSDLAHVFIGRRLAEIGFADLAGVARGRQEPEDVETHDCCVDRLKYAGGSPAVSSLENWVNRK
jgi:hypothetical protein